MKAHTYFLNIAIIISIIFLLVACDIFMEPEEEVPTYSVTYDGNGADTGSVPVDGAAYEEGETVTALLNSNGLSLDGYSFSGWNTEDDGTGMSYSPGNVFSMGNEDVVLYAQWLLIPTYTVTYDGNGADSGTVPVDGTSYIEGARVEVSGNIGNLALYGYTFVGWNTSNEGTGSGYPVGVSLTMQAENVILYAQWS